MTWLKKHDVVTKALSVLIAFVLWFYVVNVTDLSKNYKMRGIAPVFVGVEEIMASRNLTVVGKYSVDIEVSGSRQDIMSLTKADVKVEVDISKITAPGTYELPYTVELPSSAYTLRGKSPQKLTVKLDEENVKTVPITLSTDDLAAEGYVIDKANITMTPKEIKLVGLLENIEKIAYAEIKIPHKNLKSSIAGKVEYEFYDIDGKVIRDAGVSADYDEIDLILPVLKAKELPLSIEVQGSDSFKKYVEYSFVPEKILVAGEESRIEQMSSIVAGTIKISDITSGMKKDYTLTMPEGILNLSGEMNATATINLDGLSKKTVKTTLIEVINTYTLPSGYKIRPVTTSLDVSILGTDEVLKQVNSNNVRAVVDLQSTVLSKGTHPVNATIIVDGITETAVAGAEKYVVYVEVS